MNNLFFLEAKCVKTGKTFYPRYDLAADDRWSLTYGVADLPVGETVTNMGSAHIDISNARTGPQYRCPYCGNTDFVRCGRCKQITCHDGYSESFSCAHCGNVGRITGYIENVNIKGVGHGQ